MRFLPTALDRRGEFVLPTLGWQPATMAASHGEAVPPKLGIDVSELWCSPGEDEGTKGGSGLQRSFRDS
jgi:hypothetical protein